MQLLASMQALGYNRTKVVSNSYFGHRKVTGDLTFARWPEEMRDIETHTAAWRPTAEVLKKGFPNSRRLRDWWDFYMLLDDDRRGRQEHGRRLTRPSFLTVARDLAVAATRR